MSVFASAPPKVEKLSTSQVVSYAFGDVANNLAFMMTSMFLAAYMTNIAGVSAGVAGAIYGVTKIWAGVADLVAGNTVDKANTRWGRLRPWVLFGSFPLVAMLVALFSNPFGLSGTAIVVWILLFDAAFQLAYSFVNIPYGSLSAAMTQDPVDRSKLAGARSIGSALTGVALTIVVAPQFRNSTKPAEELAWQFSITTIVLGLIAIVLYLICFKNTREVVPRAPGKMKFSQTLKMVFKNGPLLTLCLGALFLLGAMFTMMAVTVYYGLFILGNASALIYLQIAQTVGTVLVASLVPAITVKMGKRIGYVALSLVAVAAYIMIALVPGGQTTTALVVAIAAWFIYGIGVGGTNALMFSMQADTVDYGEWKTGVRAEGGSYSILSFVRKVGQGFGGWIALVVIGAFGYSKENAEAAMSDPELASRIEQGIRITAGWLPAGLAILAAAVIFFYPLSAKKHRDLIEDLTTRRAKRIAEEEGVSGALSLGADGEIVASRPVITVNEQYGAGGAYVAQRVAERLRVPYLSSKFSSEEIERIDESADADSGGGNRWVWDMAHASGGVGADSSATNAADAEATTALVRDNTRELLTMVRGEGGAIVGRDATVVLAGIEGTYHVRLEAPVGTRIQRAAEEAGISQDVAARRQAREDQLRTEMSRRLMKWTPSNTEHYDLVVDTGQTSLDDAVDRIVEGYRAKYPDIG